MTIQMKALSFSAIKMFEQCPYQYYCMKYQSDKYPYQQGKEAARGEAIHKEFEDYIKSGQPLAMAAKWQPFMDDIAALDGKKYTEHKMALNWQCEKVAYFKGKDIWLRGQCDLIVEHGKEAVILDYKTGKSKYADTGQLKMMAMMAFCYLPKVDTIKAALMFVDEDKAVEATFERKFQQEYVDHWFERSAPIVRATNNFVADIPTKTFPQHDGFLCAWCSVTDCPRHP